MIVGDTIGMTTIGTKKARSNAAGNGYIKRLSPSKRREYAFYVAMLAWPVLQFCVFYIGVNFNSFLLAFKKISVLDNTTVFTFDNIKNACKLLFLDDGMKSMTFYSCIAYVVSLVISVPLGLLFSFYIAKKMKGSAFYRVVLFLPSILPAIVLVVLFNSFVENGLETFLVRYMGKTSRLGLLSNKDTRFYVVLFYNIWICFGTSVLMYSNKMSGIAPEISEAAQLDGATGFKEFLYIHLPLVYPTLTIFLYTGIGGIFTNQLNLYSFYGSGAREQTFGYFLYVQAKRVDGNLAEYPMVAAYGLLFTVIAVPLTLLVKWLLEKFGPGED